jgi:hypothetical protein
MTCCPAATSDDHSGTNTHLPFHTETVSTVADKRVFKLGMGHVVIVEHT